jgi:hypothetical protein
MPVNYTKFKLLSNVRDKDLLSEIESNLKMFCDWALLGAGGWIDVTIPQSGVYGGDEHILRVSSDDSYTEGQAWEGFRKDWVWETGVEYDSQPIAITGVRVDGTFYGSGDSDYGWHINYPLGQVIFNEAIPTTSEVALSYSYRWAQIYIADDAPWWTELQYNSHRADDQFINEDGGDWIIGPHRRVQMPSIVIESVARGSSRGYELGNNALNVEQTISFNVIAECRADRNKMLDYLRNQKDKTIYLFKSNDVINSGDYPLDYRGMLVGDKMYPDLVDAEASGGYRWKRLFISDSHISETQSWHPGLFEGSVTWETEVIRGDTQ